MSKLAGTSKIVALLLFDCTLQSSPSCCFSVPSRVKPLIIKKPLIDVEKKIFRTLSRMVYFKKKDDFGEAL